MKVIKINISSSNAFTSLLSSMNNSREISVCNNLDACGCTGNDNC